MDTATAPSFGRIFTLVLVMFSWVKPTQDQAVPGQPGLPGFVRCGCTLDHSFC